VDCPQCPTGWRQLGAAGAHRSSALHGYGAPFSVFSLPTEPVECEEPTKGVFYRRGGGAPEQDVRRQGSSLKLWRWWGTLQGSAHDKLGQTGATQNVEHRHRVVGARGLSHEGVNLGFVSIFFEILAQLPPIYKGFELIISCACRDLSLSFQIRLGFDISSDFIEILVGGISVSVATRHEVGDNQH
jgi:hypothetical protein